MQVVFLKISLIWIYNAVNASLNICSIFINEFITFGHPVQIFTDWIMVLPIIKSLHNLPYCFVTSYPVVECTSLPLIWYM